MLQKELAKRLRARYDTKMDGKAYASYLRSKCFIQFKQALPMRRTCGA